MVLPSVPQTTTGDPDETVPVDQLISAVVPDPDDWKATPNPRLAGRTPGSMIGTPDEPVLRDLLRAVKHGFAS
jgi:hypothetical protein